MADSRLIDCKTEGCPYTVDPNTRPNEGVAGFFRKGESVGHAAKRPAFLTCEDGHTNRYLVPAP